MPETSTDASTDASEGSSGSYGASVVLKPEVSAAILWAASELKINPNFLASVISFETAGTFKTSIQNPTSSATGLIQFMEPSDGKEDGKYFGYSRTAFGNLSHMEQMKYVVKYFRGRNLPAGASLGKIYDAVTGTGYRDIPKYNKKGKRVDPYHLNRVWDANKDGYIAPGESVTSGAFKAHIKNFFPESSSASSTNSSQYAGQDKPIYFGDSIAHGYKFYNIKNTNESTTKGGESPYLVYNRIKTYISKNPNALKGKAVVLSSGKSNMPTGQDKYITQQIQLLKNAGAVVYLLGIAYNYSNPKYYPNANVKAMISDLEGIAKDTGVPYLGNFKGDDKIHPFDDYKKPFFLDRVMQGVPKVKAATTSSGNTAVLYIGDSIADGYRRNYGKNGAGKASGFQSPAAVLAYVQSYSKSQLEGTTVILSTGLSNKPEDRVTVAQQLSYLHKNGAITKVLGVASNYKQNTAKGTELNNHLNSMCNLYKSCTFLGGFKSNGNDNKAYVHPADFNSLPSGYTPPQNKANTSGNSASKNVPDGGSINVKKALNDSERAIVSQLHPDLQAVINALAKKSLYGFTVVDGIRTADEQSGVVRSRPEKSIDSRHLTGHAVDIVAHTKADEVSKDVEDYNKLASQMRAAAQSVGIQLEWGGTWSGKYNDVKHWQLPINTHPPGDIINNSPIASTSADAPANKAPIGETGYTKLTTSPGVYVTEEVTVVYVSDGDSVIVKNSKRNDGKPFSIRLEGIDAPETVKYVNGIMKSPAQYYGLESKNHLRGLLSPGTVVTVTYSGQLDRGRAIAKLVTKDSKLDISAQMVRSGMAISAYGTTYRDEEAIAREGKAGMWINTTRVIDPKKYRDNVESGSLMSRTYGSKSAEQALAINARITNDWSPAPGSVITSNFGRRVTPDTKENRAKGTAGTITWHWGVDYSAKEGTPILCPCEGVASQSVSEGYGNTITVVCAARGFTLTFAHLSRFNNFGDKSGKNSKVKKGDVIGYMGSTGSTTGTHLHYQLEYNGVKINPLFTVELDTIPKNVDLVPGLYINKAALRSNTDYDKTSLSVAAGAESLAGSLYDSATSSTGIQRNLTDAEIRGYEVTDVLMDQTASVFDDNLQSSKHLEKMFTNIDMGLNISFPIIKAYAIVGTESGNLFTEKSPIVTPLYFELPTLNNLHVETNNDYNPVDVCIFSMVNPNSVRSSTEYYGSASFGSNVYNADTQYYNLFYADRIKLKPGMKIHIKAGYSNSPNKLTTIFNGIIKEVGGTKDLLLSVVCESYGAELLQNSMSPHKPTDMSGGKNASTGLLMAYSLLMDNISHFGSKATKTKTTLAYMNYFWSGFSDGIKNTQNGSTILNLFKSEDEQKAEEAARISSVEGIINSDDNKSPESVADSGDYRDPENKSLVAPLKISNLIGLWNPSRANLPQRLFTNIYSDAIEAAHDQYRDSLWARVQGLLDFMDSKMFYKYFAFRSTSWSVLKEMEYRHPGTLAKPLWYDERMTMFYGIKEQLYIARDLSPVYMFKAGMDSLYKNKLAPYSADYTLQRHKRLEPATGFHLLSSKMNILSNNLTLSRDFATKINVVYYEKDYNGNQMKSDSNIFSIVADDNIVPFDLREETISLNGCHGEYLSWLYGINELKKQTEQMYTGSITITGKADVRAGDYAYLEDTDRGMSGVIKIREASHHFTQEGGYVTVITPGLHVECTQFYWSTLFTQLGMAAKMALMKSDLTVNHLLTSNQVASNYLEYLKVIQNSKLKTGDKLIGMSGSIAVSSLGMHYLHKMMSKSSILKSGMTKTQFASMWKTSSNIANLGYDFTKLLLDSKLTDYKQAVGVVNKAGKITPNPGLIGSIKNRVTTLAKLTGMGVKTISRIPLTAVRGAVGMGVGIARGLLGILACNPIGAIMYVVGTILTSALMSKFKEIGLTHNPILMFPISYNGRPHVAGITGYENNSFIEGYIKNLKRNMQVNKKAADSLRLSASSTSAAAEVTATALDTLNSGAAVILSTAEGISKYLNTPSEDGY